MNKKILYLHVGWSKTGTSAVQSQAQRQREDLLANGVLYPQSLQWPDHSHHPFALAFKGDKGGGYSVDMSAVDAMNMLKSELQDSGAESVLISSELSPIYYHNPRFVEFVNESFDEVKVLFTVRLQSELLMSLMNQLVKDPNIRYKGSIFQLAIQNLNTLSYYKRIKVWEKFVGKANIHCFSYSKNIVGDFLNFFGVELDDLGNELVINKSVPNRILPLLQSLSPELTNQQYLDKTEELIRQTQSEAHGYKQIELFSVGEQHAYDNYFEVMNHELTKEYLTEKFPKDKEYRSVLVFT
ncbi:hypothetical protein [Pseudoalteromonas marina]|uniref:hypothetical protein n=1 Tax=Pseudoalteromonas marina TaxID=267375 RepID=UPI0023F3D6DC|nr:hypothetical protein [Pseudoalteromonas marina]